MHAMQSMQVGVSSAFFVPFLLSRDGGKSVCRFPQRYTEKSAEIYVTVPRLLSVSVGAYAEYERMNQLNG